MQTKTLQVLVDIYHMQRLLVSHSGSGSGKIPDSFHLYPGRLLGIWASSVINRRPTLSISVLGVRRRLVCHKHCCSLSVVTSVLTVHMGTPQRPGEKMSATMISATAAGVIKTLLSREQRPGCAISHPDHFPPERHLVIFC